MSDQPLLPPLRVHATAVAIDGYALLLRGQPGAGKSDLALRLIDAGARLVTDDQSVLSRRGEHILVCAPDRISGLMEVRGIGIMRVEAMAEAPVALLVDLVPPEQIDRMPERRREMILGLSLPLIAVAPFEASAPAKLRLALRALTQPGLPVML
jgi:serine kinase of HPr protein (carbohydrate metabolism regulator)